MGFLFYVPGWLWHWYVNLPIFHWLSVSTGWGRIGESLLSVVFVLVSVPLAIAGAVGLLWAFFWTLLTLIKAARRVYLEVYFAPIFRPYLFGRTKPLRDPHNIDKRTWMPMELIHGKRPEDYRFGVVGYRIFNAMILIRRLAPYLWVPVGVLFLIMYLGPSQALAGFNWLMSHPNGPHTLST